MDDFWHRQVRTLDAAVTLDHLGVGFQSHASFCIREGTTERIRNGFARLGKLVHDGRYHMYALLVGTDHATSSQNGRIRLNWCRCHLGCDETRDVRDLTCRRRLTIDKSGCDQVLHLFHYICYRQLVAPEMYCAMLQ